LCILGIAIPAVVPENIDILNLLA